MVEKKSPGGVVSSPGVVAACWRWGKTILAQVAQVVNLTAWAFFILEAAMQSRSFVWTWWAGLVSDTFGPRSVFHRASIGVLRDRRRALAPKVSFGKRRSAAAAAPLGTYYQHCSQHAGF